MVIYHDHPQHIQILSLLPWWEVNPEHLDVLQGILPFLHDHPAPAMHPNSTSGQKWTVSQGGKQEECLCHPSLGSIPQVNCKPSKINIFFIKYYKIYCNFFFSSSIIVISQFTCIYILPAWFGCTARSPFLVTRLCWCSGTDHQIFCQKE